jgi:hypothetical protein
MGKAAKNPLPAQPSISPKSANNYQPPNLKSFLAGGGAVTKV